MNNEDYREKIEEHRQSIEMEEQKNKRMSRSRGKVVKKKRKNPLMNSLLFILLGIPFLILIYVSFIYDYSEEPDETAVEENGSVVEVQKNNTVSASTKTDEKPEIDKENDEQAAEDQAKIEEAKKQAEIDAAKLEEQAKQEELAKQKEEEEKAEQQNQKVHTVQSNENLFRIALKYYDDASGVEKIKEANNLSNDSISVGQTLIIP